MDLTRPDAYGRAFADVYDRWYADVSDADATARFVADRCRSGLVIELGVGSGRLARPLVAHGLAVIGIDASLPMMSACPPSVMRVAADMSLLPLRAGGAGRSGGPAQRIGPTVLCGFNTLFNLVSDGAHRRLWAELAALNAAVIVETTDVAILAGAKGPSTGIGRQHPPDGGIVVTSTVVDAASQRVIGRHLEISDRGVISRPWLLRWLDLLQLDSLAGIGGFELTERYRSWDEDPFDPNRGPHAESVISVYQASGPSADSGNIS